MNSNIGAVISVVAFAALALPSLAAQPTKIDFSDETAGAEPKSLVPVVGVWRIENDAGKKVLAVDGRQWKEGQSSAGIGQCHALVVLWRAAALDCALLVVESPPASIQSFSRA